MSSAHLVSDAVPGPGDDDGTIGEVHPSGGRRPKFQERRKSRRFPVHQHLHCREVDYGAGCSAGTGLTLDMSSSGIRFSIQEQIPLGYLVELSVDWPVRLEGTCSLKLFVAGRVVRSEAGWAALSILQYEFRTKGSGLAQRVAPAHFGTSKQQPRKRPPKYGTDQARDAAPAF